MYRRKYTRKNVSKDSFIVRTGLIYKINNIVKKACKKIKRKDKEI